MYYHKFLKRGSWRDAEHDCIKIGANLWSINSYTEGNTIFESFGIYYFKEMLSTYNKGTIQLLKTTLIFIGLRRVTTQVLCTTELNFM